MTRRIGAVTLFIALLSVFAATGSETRASEDLGSEATAARDLVPRHWSLRFAGGLAQPLGDLANDDPQSGWVGGQGLGYALHAGVRIPFMRDVFVRPELSFYGFGNHRDRELPVLVFDGSASDPDTVDGDWTRKTLMGGLRVHLDYIPADRGFVSPFLNGGLGLIYMRLEDEILLPDIDRIEVIDETLGLSASLGLGLLIGNAEIMLAGTFQEPGFTEATSVNAFGATSGVSWFTADLSVGFSVPIIR